MLRPAKSSHAMTSRSAGLLQRNASTIARANCKSVTSLYAQVDCVAADQVTVGPAELVILPWNVSHEIDQATLDDVEPACDGSAHPAEPS